MLSASTRLPSQEKIIPIFPESRYKSLEYSIKRLIAMRSRATYSEVTNVILQLKHRRVLGDFKIQANKLNRKQVGLALSSLCREKKVIRKAQYFESAGGQIAKRNEVARLKALTVLLVC